MPKNPPYPPMTSALGGVPTTTPDVPICVVFLVIYLVAAVCHMTFLQVNLKRGHKFIISGALFGFCFSRTVTMILRIVWSQRPTNIKVAIASMVFVYAGVVLLFIINLLFAQRIIRAQHPHTGWHRLFHYFFQAIYVLIVITLAMLITTVIQSFYTLNSNTHRIDRDVMLYGQTFYAVVSFLPIPIVLLGLAIPRKQAHHEKFGQGRFRHKIAILLVSSVLLCLGASFRAGTNYLTPRARTNPAWYQSKACFYIFDFTVEILVVWLYVLVRVDKRFWVPNGSHGPGDYSRARSGYESHHQTHPQGDDDDGVVDKEAAVAGAGDSERDLRDAASDARLNETAQQQQQPEVEVDRGFNGRIAIAPEEEIFDDMTAKELAEADAEKRMNRANREGDLEMMPVNATEHAPAHAL